MHCLRSSGVLTSVHGSNVATESNSLLLAPETTACAHICFDDEICADIAFCKIATNFAMKQFFKMNGSHKSNTARACC